MADGPISRIDSSYLPVAETVVRGLEKEVLDLHDLLRPRLFRYAISLGLKAQDAEDVIQEVFLALFRHLKAEKPRSNLHGWIFRVTHHLALKRRTRYRKEDCTDESGRYSLTAGQVWSPEEQLIFSGKTVEGCAVFSRLCRRLTGYVCNCVQRV